VGQADDDNRGLRTLGLASMIWRPSQPPVSCDDVLDDSLTGDTKARESKGIVHGLDRRRSCIHVARQITLVFSVNNKTTGYNRSSLKPRNDYTFRSLAASHSARHFCRPVEQAAAAGRPRRLRRGQAAATALARDGVGR
jgi:predicted nucleic acid-binding protein